MEKNSKVKVEILGKQFSLVSGEKTAYLIDVAKMVDERMKELRFQNPQMSYEDAAVLTALNFCDELYQKNREDEQRQAEEADKIRTQLVEYSKELSDATATIKKLQKELEQMKMMNQ